MSLGKLASADLTQRKSVSERSLNLSLKENIYWKLTAINNYAFICFVSQYA